ncbi:unnamed protein product [Chilo suppressalis]|uniref:Uncharacterized protein n=1 Tax=Chilo suppressalis TaxID=168631 RepID=A0ABN8AQ01_CHISP|nr:unnamed protein product [Chilo suppressalis]
MNFKQRALSNSTGKPMLKNLIMIQCERTTSNCFEDQPIREDTKACEETRRQYERNEVFRSQVERFIEISKYFSSPLRKTASYICENRLVSYPNPYRIEYKRGGVTTQHIKFCNLTLEPVFIKLYKLIPDLEQLRYTNLSLSRCKRIPPGLAFNLGFVYDDVNEKPSCNAKMVFVASRRTSTPCYQICEIELHIGAQMVSDCAIFRARMRKYSGSEGDNVVQGVCQTRTGDDTLLPLRSGNHKWVGCGSILP